MRSERNRRLAISLLLSPPETSAATSRSRLPSGSVVSSVVAEVRRRYPGVAVAESGHTDLHRRAEIGVAVVSSTAAHAVEVLEACERLVASRPDIELLSARQRLLTEEE